MSITEILLLIVSILLFGIMTVGIILCIAVKFFREHRFAAVFVLFVLFIAIAVLLSLFLAVHYDLGVQLGTAAVLLGVATALALAAVLIVFGIVPTGARHKVSWLTGAVVLIVLFVQISVNVAYPYDFDGNAEAKTALSSGVLLTRVISGTFQSFSLDAGYADIVRIGSLVFDMGGVYLFYVLACSMTVIAPIVGGFAIFGVLGHFFPRIALWRNIQPTKYVFSELNEYSIETAESIVALKKRLSSDKKLRMEYIREFGVAAYSEIMRSVIVFTDVYSDKKSEDGSELLGRAHKLNAICLKDDILSRKIYWIAGYLYRAITHTQKKVVYFLMDQSDFYVEQGAENNLQTAVSLFTTDKSKMMWYKTHGWQVGMKATSVEVYVFSRSPNADAVIGEARENFVNTIKPSKGSFEYKTINEYQNLVYNLINGFGDVAVESACGKAESKPHDGEKNAAVYPLYSGLDKRPDGAYDTRSLSVLIVGGGRIAKTFFKSAYWCGQMLCGDVPTRLYITVLSLDAEQSETRLKFECPSIFDKENCDYEKNENSYFEYNFVQANYGSAEFADKLADILQSDKWSPNYVLIALGADNLNMQAADYLKCELCRHSRGNRVVPINYVIENSELCDALRGTKSKGVKPPETDKKEPEKAKGSAETLLSAYATPARVSCVLHPFGSLKERFSFENICMFGLERFALIADDGYNGTDENKRKEQAFKNAYSRNSSIASVLHLPYKKQCIDLAAKDGERNIYFLEHRRWNAYIRSIGYRCYTAKEFAEHLCYDVDKDTDGICIRTKDEGLKLHACLIETPNKLTEKSVIGEFLTEHPDFFEKVEGALKAIANGKALTVSGGAIGKPRDVESLADFCQYVRELFGGDAKDLDDLDIMSAIRSSRKDGKVFAYNFKDNDKKVCSLPPGYTVKTYI